MSEADRQDSLAAAGWGFPATSRKCHYFPAGSSTSLCGRWGFYMGRLDTDTGEPSRDDCAACRLRLRADPS